MPQTIRCIYKNANNESLRIDFKYAMDEEYKKPLVTYQSISGESGVITQIYNFLFNSSMTPSDMSRYVTSLSDIAYRGKSFKFTFEQDEYAPGYWKMIFMD